AGGGRAASGGVRESGRAAWLARRRGIRAGVLGARWRSERKNAATAATPAARDSVQCCAYAPTRTGNDPQATANHTSLCSTPPKSSRLYAYTSTPPTITNGSSFQPP